MSNECRHWDKKSLDGSDDKQVYCADCMLIFNVVPAYRGTLNIGKLQTTFDYIATSDNLDLVKVITDNLGSKNITIGGVFALVDTKYFNNKIRMTFMAGNAPLIADIEWYKSQSYTDTNTYATLDKVEDKEEVVG